MNFLKQFAIYGVAGALSRLAAIVLVPLYTRALSIPEYGQLEILLAVYSLGVLLIGMQSESAVARDYHETGGATDRAALMWSSLGIVVAGTVFVCLLAAVAQLSGWLPAYVATYLAVLVVIGVPAQMFGIQLVMLRFAGRPVLYALLAFADLSLAALLSAVLIVGFDWGIGGALAGLGLSKLLLVSAAWPMTFGRPVIRRDQRADLRRMLAYSLPTMPAVLLNWLQTLGSRVVLALFFTLTEVAILGVALKVAALFGFLTYAFRLVWEPYSFERLARREDSSAEFQKILNLYLAGMFMLAALAALASQLIVAILAPPAYAGAAPLVGAFVFAQYWTGATVVMSIGIHAARVTGKLSLVYLFSTAVTGFLLVVFAPLMSLGAAGIAIFVSSLSGALFSEAYTRRYAGFGFDRRIIAAAAIMSSLLAAASYGFFSTVASDASANWLLGAYVVAACVSVTAALLLARVALGPLRMRRIVDDLQALR